MHAELMAPGWLILLDQHSRLTADWQMHIDPPPQLKGASIGMQQARAHHLFAEQGGRRRGHQGRDGGSAEPSAHCWPGQ